MSSRILIGGVETFSTVDFPEKISSVVFMQGCPWRCPFCHNIALQTAGTDNGFVWEKFINFLEARKGILDAVVFSGGEPLLQDGLVDALKEVKSLGYLIGLHTGGYRPKALAAAVAHVDWVGFDIKAPFEESKYKQATGCVSVVENVVSSLSLLLENGVDFECRTTCDPRILSIKDICEIIDCLKNKGVKKYFLQKYRQIEGDSTEDAECEKFFMDKELLEYAKKSFAEFGVRK